MTNRTTAGRTPLTLRLGLESQHGRQLLLEAAAERASWAPVGHKLAEWTHPWFSLLCLESKKKWWTGLWLVSSPDAQANLDSQSVLEEAAAAFGEAVAMELRHSVFRPFLLDQPVSSPSGDSARRVGRREAGPRDSRAEAGMSATSEG